MSAQTIYSAFALARRRMPSEPAPSSIRHCTEHDNTFDVRKAGCIYEDCQAEWLVGHDRYTREVD